MFASTKRIIYGGMAAALLTGGALTLMLGGAASALAQGTPTQASGSTTATATVANSTTLTDNTPNISFGNPVVLGAENVSTAPVNLSVSSNDSSGWETSATETNSDVAEQSGLYNGAGNQLVNFIPGNDLAVQPSGGGTYIQGNPGTGDVTYFNQNPGNNGPVGPGIDNANGPGNVTLNDNWELNVPANQTPGTYTGTIQYWITPS
jgi:hypothetical protein